MDEYFYLWAQWGAVNAHQFHLVLNHYGNLETAWKKVTPDFLLKIGLGDEKLKRLLQIKSQLSFYHIISDLERFGVRILSPDDSEYPFYLKQISDPPPFLFVRGKLPSFHKSIGVVGTRKITDYGRLATEKLVPGLVRSGTVIVSGLALGVDSCAHDLTVSSGGKAVAVLGSGVDQIYPASNFRLAQRILNSGGAIVSEYPLGTPPMKHHFPARNRIISGLSRGVLVIEGGEKSGALITARYGLEQDREIFAVPHNIHKTVLCGTNKLIREGAKLVESVDDILWEFKMNTPEEEPCFDFDFEERTLLNLIASGGLTFDQLITNSSFSFSRLSVLLTNLQLKGAVREVGDRWVVF